MTDIISKPTRAEHQPHPDDLRLAQGIGGMRREIDKLREENSELHTDVAVLKQQVTERGERLLELEQKLLKSVMRNGQQESIIQQINRLTDAYEQSVDASAREMAETDAETRRLGVKFGADSQTRQ